MMKKILFLLLLSVFALNSNAQNNSAENKLLSEATQLYNNKEYEKAFKIYKKLASKGNVEAQALLGVCYYSGNGVSQNFKKSVEWSTKASNSGNAMAKNTLSTCYRYGIGVEKDMNKAIDLLGEATQKGYSVASKTKLSANDNKRYEEAYRSFGNKEYEKAVSIFKELASKGHVDSQQMLGYSFFHGLGVTRDDEEAVVLFAKSSFAGNVSGMSHLGVCYHEARGVRYDIDNAKYWLNKAADAGDVTALNNLAVLYYKGEGVMHNEERAIYLFQKAADKGSESAIRNLKKMGIDYEQKGMHNNEPKEMYNGHEYVDLGLPSGIKWATMNVGAKTPEDYGDYFAWGETKPYYTEGYSQDDPCSSWRAGKSAGYCWKSYKWYRDTNVYISGRGYITKYGREFYHGIVDNKTTLEASDDAATANWGGSWRMPTTKEIAELLVNCKYTRTTQNGVKGLKVTSIVNGKSIFFPAAGFRTDRDLSGAGPRGYYWSSSLDSHYSRSASHLYFALDGVDSRVTNRCFGHAVRPVCP